MKIRSKYVSNSSSSSFIVDVDLTDKGIACLKLNEAQKSLINGAEKYNGEKYELNVDKDLYLTEFISDAIDEKWEAATSGNYVVYESGQMCGEPYSDDQYYNKYQIDGDRSVYLRKEHDEAK